MEEASRVRVSGPLAGCAPGLIGWLTDRRYQRLPMVDHLRRLALLSRWLERDGLDPVVIDEVWIERLLAGDQQQGRALIFTRGSFRPVLDFLRSDGIVPRPARVVTPVEVLLDGYRNYLAVDRGLVAVTIASYERSARMFLSRACADDVGRVRRLSAGDVARFVIDVAEGQRASTVNTLVVGVRSLLRYCYSSGLIDTPLAQATPWLARGRVSSLPRTVAPGTADLLLDSFDRDSLVGARNFAVVKLFARLGLRVGELIAMEVDDIDWRRGEVTVRSKGGWRDPLPLPVDVGDALAAYLSRRGADAEWRHVFLHVHAPHQPMSATGVKAVIRRACARVGIADTSTHRLRHSVAQDLLRHGAALPEIGQVLRHRELATTAMYAKVDFTALASLAQPWPGSGS